MSSYYISYSVDFGCEVVEEFLVVGLWNLELCSASCRNFGPAIPLAAAPLPKLHSTSLVPFLSTPSSPANFTAYPSVLMAAMAPPVSQEEDPLRLPMPSRNPLPLSSAQEAQVRELYHARVRGYCAAEIKCSSSNLPPEMYSKYLQYSQIVP